MASIDYPLIYREHAADYDALVAAEDCDGQLAAAIRPFLGLRGTLVDVGTGTGRISRLFASRAARIIGVEPAPAMIEIAKSHRAQWPHVDWEIVAGDARRLPVPDATADLVVAGWVFGHFRSWMPDTWRAEVDTAIGEMRRVAKPGAKIVVVETLGTNHETPRSHPGLEEYFAHLEQNHGLTRHLVRTDYRFADVEGAARLLGQFFGEAMAEAVKNTNEANVPECTGIWY